MADFEYTYEIIHITNSLGEASVKYTPTSHPELATYRFPVFFNSLDSNDRIVDLIKSKAPIREWNDELNGLGLEGRIETVTLPMTGES